WFNNNITYSTSPTDPNDASRSSCVASTSNGAAFCQPLNGQYGNTGRDILRGPGINDWDIGLGKDFKFTERVSFQFQAVSFSSAGRSFSRRQPNTFSRRMARPAGLFLSSDRRAITSGLG